MTAVKITFQKLIYNTYPYKVPIRSFLCRHLCEKISQGQFQKLLFSTCQNLLQILVTNGQKVWKSNRIGIIHRKCFFVKICTKNRKNSEAKLFSTGPKSTLNLGQKRPKSITKRMEMNKNAPLLRKTKKLYFSFEGHSCQNLLSNIHICWAIGVIWIISYHNTQE